MQSDVTQARLQVKLALQRILAILIRLLARFLALCLHGTLATRSALPGCVGLRVALLLGQVAGACRAQLLALVLLHKLTLALLKEPLAAAGVPPGKRPCIGVAFSLLPGPDPDLDPFVSGAIAGKAIEYINSTLQAISKRFKDLNCCRAKDARNGSP